MAFIPKELYDTIFRNVPRLCVDMLIRNEEGAVLLTRRNIQPWKDLWHFPGGGVRFKETIEEAAKRIAKREFGVEVKIDDQAIDACQTMNDDLGPNPEDQRHSVSIVVHTRIVGGTIQETDESSKIDFFKTLPYGTHPFHGPWLTKHGFLS